MVKVVYQLHYVIVMLIILLQFIFVVMIKMIVALQYY